MEAPVTTDTVSHYTVLKKLGAGGMGEVYLAEDTVLNRRVAVKFLPDASPANQQARQRLIREAQAAARLDHPNICTIHEVGEEAGRGFIVMEYVEGETLATRIKNKRLDLNECLEIAVQVADALAEAHSQGITHRDISPQNIMLTAHHQAKVIDFGLAKVIRDRSLVDSEAVTESLLIDKKVIVGTVNYMSPEQVRGESLDARSDIFSFGAVLYEMVTGQQAFAADSTEMTIWAIVNKEPLPLRQYSSSVPMELERIVSKALKKDRHRRYQTIKKLLIDLRGLKHHLELKEQLKRSRLTNTGERGKYLPVASEPVKTIGLTLTPTVTTAAPQTQINRHGRSWIIAVVTLVLVTATLFYLLYFPTKGKAIGSIAVLPLVNAGNDPETEYLSDGITESLINSLSQVPHLRVVPRTTAFRYKGKEIDPQQVGRELDVQAVLTGKLVHEKDTVAIQVELVETSKGSQLWGERYAGNAAELLSVRQNLVRDVTARLRLTLGREDQRRLTRGDAGNSEAYQCYLRGRYFWDKRTATALQKAIQEFQEAINKDPNYALAYVGLADSYVFLEPYAGTPSSGALPNARAAVEQALQIDDSLAEAHTSLGLIEQNSWNFAEAERQHKRAIELNPNSPTAHHLYGFYLRVMGRVDEAMAEARRAHQLDPLSPIIGINVAQAHMSKGELAAASEEAKKVIEREPTFAEAHRVLAIVYWKQGRYEEATAELEKALELAGRLGLYLADLGVCYAVAGERDRARALLKELEEKYDRGEALGLNLADIFAVLGEKEQAFAWLEKDFQARSGFLPVIAHAPRFESLRAALSSDPRWNDLLRRIGLPQN